MARIAAANVLSGNRRGAGVAYEPPIAVRILRTEPEVALVGQVRDIPEGAVQGVGEGPSEGATVQLVVAPAGGHRRSLLSRSANRLNPGHSGRVLIGAVLVGPGAAEAAGQLVLAVTAGLPAATLIDIDAPDRTWASAIQTCMARTLAGH
jgi:pyruvate/2-oxoglutarate dehydrogenase complex dihydrolipoamide dehydrogenase (E3) component